jgi:hypothetical protein
VAMGRVQAGGGPTRTGILLEGRKMLYQLSYAPRPYTDIARTRYTTETGNLESSWDESA